MADLIKVFESEWKEIVDGREVYIYGAGDNAAGLYDSLKNIGSGEYIKGFLVTDAASNPETLRGLPVYQTDAFSNKNVRVIVQHTGVYRDAIHALLEKEGYTDYVNVYQLKQNARHVLGMGKANPYRDVGLEDYYKKSSKEKEYDEELKAEIIEMLKNSTADFGSSMPYQSLELINLKGWRPTTYRIRRYGLDTMLNKKMNVLNIGCNTGFIDITVADSVNSITGVEYDSELAAVGGHVAKKLHRDNFQIINSDFNTWYAGNNSHYDAMFSFAVHRWLDLTAEEYASRINKIILPGGLFWFESHGLQGGDPEYFGTIESLKKEYGFEILKDEEMADDGLDDPGTARRFVVMRKP